MKFFLRSVVVIALLVFCFSSTGVQAQSNKTSDKNPAVYIDKEGVMRWKANKQEASFFGVNYTTPFAYAYRAHKALNVDLEKAIQQDVYHMARLGFDAFRVHVWDNEIADVQGNLLDNEHLRLFDFLLAELKKRKIKTIITPIAFWGNGYPERDEDVPGFSRFYGRGKLTTNDSAIVAQEVYLKQFFQHVNPYTKLTYNDDPDVIAMEINNEPAHSGPKAGVTAYINRLAAAVKSTGWNKPVFYNISQGPYYADAVAASVANGFSFQWYPSGLVSGKTLEGNYLPHVDKYTIPFDTIPAFANKALMVYEFDAADILKPCMYPVMARSFREAGFQWATQFAYDPMAIAYGNTEYQTHYLNLAYTPGKAISMLIASRVFHQVPRKKNFGAYPADSVFDAFRVSHAQSLSEMNTETEFLYSNSTTTKPKSPAKLVHVAGVGTSEVVAYEGTGAYFLDKLETGVWRLEVMPDAIFIRDPFEKASPKKEVVRINWKTNKLKIVLPDLGNNFSLKGLNSGNTESLQYQQDGVAIKPGTYLLAATGKQYSGKTGNLGVIGLNEFVAPQTFTDGVNVYHKPAAEVTAGKELKVNAKVVGLNTGNISLQVSRVGGQSRNIAMTKQGNYDYTASIPADLVTPGMLNYRIVVRNGSDVLSFPGQLKNDPNAWDNISNETWTVYVADERGGLELFNPTTERNISPNPTWRRGFQTTYVTGEKPGQLILRMSTTDMTGVQAMGFQYLFADKLRGRQSELNNFDRIVIRARSGNGAPTKAKVVLTCSDASSVAAFVDLTTEFKDIEIPLSSFSASDGLLLPRPYPGFLPLTFQVHNSGRAFNVASAERVEVTIGSGLPAADQKKQYVLEVECIWLKKQEKKS